MNSASCLFCRIVRGEIPAAKVAETDQLLAFRDIGPQAPVHVLVIPKQHLDSLSQATDGALLGDLLLLTKQIAHDEGVDVSGYRTVINTGANGGQSVGHLHLHLLGGRALHWPPG